MSFRTLLIAPVVIVLACTPSTSTPDGGSHAPVVTSVSPSSGPVAGGLTVTINGSDFVDGATAVFGTVTVATAFASNRRLTAITPMATKVGPVSVTVKNPDGQSNTLSEAFTYTGLLNTKSITEAVLRGPIDSTDVSGALSVSATVIGDVQVDSVTNLVGQGAGVRAQVGFSAQTSAVPTNADFTWSDAAYTADSDNALRDSYSGTLSLPAASGEEPVSYVLAIRFSVDDGLTWTIADRDGSANGVVDSQLARVTVGKASNPSVEWCKLGGDTVEAPPSVVLHGSEVGPVIYGQVYKTDITSHSGMGLDLKGQLGYGLAGESASSWTWVDAAFNADKGNNDEFSAQLPNPGVGTWKFAFRFNHANGDWSYCDADGLALNAFTEEQAGTLTVEASTGPELTECIIESISANQSVGPNGISAPYTALITVPTITDSTGQGATLTVEIGSGSPSTAPSTWTNWKPATYANDESMADRYSATLTAPASPATALVAYRVQIGTDSPVYCDLDGAKNGFQEVQAARLTVPNAEIDWCKLGGESLEAPPSLFIAQSALGPVVYGQVFKTDITGMAGAGAGIKGAVGYGTPDSAPSTWTWVDATFNVDKGNNDEFQAQLPNPGLGTWKFAFRFSHADGSWSYCDADGLAIDGFSQAQAGTLTVQPESAAIDWCKLGGEVIEPPPSIALQGSVPGPTIYGQVYQAGITSSTGAGTGIKGALGYGAEGTSPSAWTWVDATFNTDKGNNDEFAAQLPNPGSGAWKFAFRFNHDDGPWSYCDADGLALDGFTVAQAGSLTVDAGVTAIVSCRLNAVSAATVASGGALTVNASALIPGVSSLPGASPSLRIQVGVGPRGDDASHSTQWGWKDATFLSDVGNQDEFAATIYPAYSGDRSVSARASLDGVQWLYCDLNGSDIGGYQVAQQYDVSVSGQGVFDFCNTQWPPSADAGTIIFGQVYATGITPNPSAPVIAQLGVGREAEDPGLSWEWTTATFNSTAGNNNEYSTALSTNVTPGHRYAFRFTADGGAFCYGDIDGSTNGFSAGSNLGLITP